MRIISQLVPGGKHVSTDIEALRNPDKNTWEIQTWGHPLALGVYPFFITKDRNLIPIGTAFCVNKLGVSMTALENIRESIQRYLPGPFLSKERGSARYTMKDIEMAVFHHRSMPGGIVSGDIRHLESIDEVPPTDICYTVSRFQSGFLTLPLPLSFVVPHIGSRVVCVGFSKMSAPAVGFSFNDIQSGCIDLLKIYEHKLHAIEARVTHIFTRQFTNEFIGGPCFIIDAEIEQGMIGGPVFLENGYVCGIASAASTNFFDEPSSIISLLYPALAMNIKFGGRIGPLQIRSNRQLIELIAQGLVITDGSENIVTRNSEKGKIILSQAIQGENINDIYDDFAAFREERRACKEL